MALPRKVSIDALAAAALAAEGKTQIEIAATLRKSQSAVSRLLDGVKDYIHIEKSFRWDALDAATGQEVRRIISHREIVDRLARLAREHEQPAPTVHVAPMGAAASAGAQFDTFAGHAAMALRELLGDVTGPVGVAWGSTLWHTVQALRSILPQHPFRERIPIEFVPLCGDPLIDSQDSQERYADRTSSRIVSELSKAVNGDEPRPAWLGLVPAFIPPAFKPHEIAVIDRLIDLVPQYPRIFGHRIARSRTMRAPIAGNLHMVITAVGSSKRPLGFGRNPLLGLNKAESERLAASIHGDIGGVLLPRLTDRQGKKGRQAVPDRLVQDLTRRWTGLKIEHLKECAARAFSEGSKSRPGVALLSFGEGHVDVVLEAVRQGLVNHLIIGSDLEAAMVRALPPGGGESAGEELSARDTRPAAK
jgi:predicted transcriptional regulator